MEFIYSPRFLRAYKKLPMTIREQTDRCIELLESNPYHPSLHVHKRRGEGEVWQARITRSYRLFFAMEGQTITLISVEPHEK